MTFENKLGVPTEGDSGVMKAGITPLDDNIDRHPRRGFPGKFLDLLHLARPYAFKKVVDKGFAGKYS